jgi:aspartyl-tRNA(Asn)/glutamyl-tRNA(Gln) amidotransferase subunit A
MGPVTPTVAKNIGDNRDDPTADWLADVYTLGVSLAGLPGMSIPCGFGENGLPPRSQGSLPPEGAARALGRPGGAGARPRPVGLQIIGNYFDEGRLLAIADRYQQVTDWHTRAPVQQG